MAYSPGDSLTSYPHLEQFSDKDPEGLKAQLDQIRLPYKIIAIYGLNGRHFAWTSLTKAVKKETKQTNNKE